MPLPSAPATLQALQAMQTIILSEVLVSAASPFAALSTSDAARYGVARAVFVGRPKDFSDAYLPQCSIWIPPTSPTEEAQQPLTFAGYAGRVAETVEAYVTAYADMRSNWWAGEQQILAIRDALLPVVLKHAQLGGTLATVTQAWVAPGRGLCYETVAGVEYRAYELRWSFRQQYVVAGGKTL